MTDRDQVPDPDDPEFFAKYTMPEAIRNFAFGPAGGTPPPRVVRSGRPTRSADEPDDPDQA